MKYLYNKVCLVVCIVNRFGEKRADLPYTVVCGVGGFTLRPSSGEQCEVEGRGHGSWNGQSSVASVSPQGGKSVHTAALGLFCPRRLLVRGHCDPLPRASYPVLSTDNSLSPKLSVFQLYLNSILLSSIAANFR